MSTRNPSRLRLALSLFRHPPLVLWIVLIAAAFGVGAIVYQAADTPEGARPTPTAVVGDVGERAAWFSAAVAISLPPHVDAVSGLDAPQVAKRAAALADSARRQASAGRSDVWGAASDAAAAVAADPSDPAARRALGSAADAVARAG
jgi:hypothetical protein